MKKAFVAVALILVLGLMSNVALTDETITFPYWQHSYGLATFWSISNAGTVDSVVTINLFADDPGGDYFFTSTTATVAPGTSWQPDSQWSATQWLPSEGKGYGNFEVVTTEANVYLWACVYADLGNSLTGGGGVPGYTIVLPGNPYGI